MQLEFRFYIDGTEIDAPDSWESFKMILQRDPDLRGVLRSFSNAMTVTRTDFATLYAKIENHLFDTPLTFRVDYSTNNGSSYSEFMSAYIFIDDISFDLIRRTAEFTLTDISYSAKIQQNADLVFSSSATASKNGTAITAAERVSTYLGYGLSNLFLNNAFTWDEVLRHIIAYITDDGVEIDDNWYPSLNEASTANDEQLIFFGPTPKLFGTPPIQIQSGFNKIFVGVARLFNLWYCLTEISGTAYFTVDTEVNHFASTTGITLEDFTKFSVRFSSDYNYTSVRVGDKNKVDSYSDNGFGDAYIFKANYVSCFGENVFYLESESNVKGQELDLTTDFQYQLPSPAPLSSVDSDKSQMIHCEDTGSDLIRAFKTADYPFNRYNSNSGYWDYQTSIGNGFLQNTEILGRYNFLKDIRLSNVKNYSATLYVQTLQSVGTTSETINFDRNAGSSSDPERCWDDGERSYIFKGCADQSHTYRVQVSVDVTDTSGSANNISMEVKMYDIEGVEIVDSNLLATREVDSVSLAGFGSDTLTWDNYINVDDPKTYMQFLVVGSGNFTVATTSYVTFTQQDAPGRTLTSANSSAVKAYEVEIESFCTISDFLTIWQDPRKRIALNLYDENTKYAWVKDLEYTPATGQLEGTLMTDDTNLNT